MSKVSTDPLMIEKKDLLQEWKPNGGLYEDQTYSDSRILPTDALTVFEGPMRSLTNFEIEVKAPSYGNDWVKNFDKCALEKVNFMKERPPKFGITPNTMVSLLDVKESSNDNMFNNEMKIMNYG